MCMQHHIVALPWHQLSMEQCIPCCMLLIACISSLKLRSKAAAFEDRSTIDDIVLLLP